MTTQSDLIEMGKTKLTQLKVFLDELEVQMALGKSEARDVFERERKTFQQYINEQKQQFKKAGESVDNHRKMLADKFDALELLLQKEVATSAKKFDHDKKATLRAIYELEHAMKETYGEMSLGVQIKLDGLKNRMDNYRIELALAEFEQAAELEAKKANLLVAVEAIKEKFRKEEGASEKIDQFAAEINQSVEHLKKAFNELFS